ncbi:MAG: YhcN/YlaJ family sporulation lipoprotein [Mahellales bacterium]|jgi:YhcN/YlaJ family sporulation lipoprotein
MSLKNKKLLSIIFVIILGLCLIVSCAPARTPAPTDRDPDPTRLEPTPTPQDRVRRTPLVPDDPSDDPSVIDDKRAPANDAAKRADRIASRLANLNDINRATVVISNRTALVGVEISDRLRGRMTTAQKRKIEDEVKNVDNSINTVVVTAEPDLFTRIKNIADDIGRGRPLSGFTSEINELVNRIKPQME